MASDAPKGALIFDGDDTLWRTMPLYAQAKERFFRLMEGFGFGRPEVESSFERRDIENVGQWGFTVERFRRSMVETLEEFSSARGESPKVQIAERVSRIATSVSRNKTRRMPGAGSVLQKLSGQFRMILLTKGEYDLQERRIEESGFRSFLEEVVIVERKDQGTFERIVRDVVLDPAVTWSVGDSLRSDIAPALAVGLGAVWIPQNTWGYEITSAEKHERLIQISSIPELPNALKQAGAFQ